jgi:predicted nucleotidyltransferase component of viral defense system
MPERSRPPPNNVGAAVRQRLLNLAHARGQPMELLLTRYALERLLHRLSLSPHRERFVLKGAMLLTTWFNEPHRATRDVDLLGFGDPAADALLGTFREIMAVEPGVEDIELPVLLGMPPPRLRAYAPETVIAEKLHAMVILGRANSRMKDYYDIWMLTGAFEIDPERLRRAITATFARRNTAIPAEMPDGLGDAFAADPGKQRQWDAFARNLAATPPELGVVVSDLRNRLARFL